MMEKKMEATIVYWGYIGITDKKIETPIVSWCYIGMMAKKMETAIFAILYRNLETGNYYSDFIRVMDKQMQTRI